MWDLLKKARLTMTLRKSRVTSIQPPFCSKTSSKAMARSPAMPVAVFFQYRPRRVSFPFSFPSKPFTTWERPTFTVFLPPEKNCSRAAANSLCSTSRLSRWGKHTPYTSRESRLALIALLVMVFSIGHSPIPPPPKGEHRAGGTARQR